MESGVPVMLSLVGRMALVALVIGTAVTTSATERVTLSLVLAGAIGWSFVPLLQLFTGWMLVRGFAQDRVRLLNRYFATHWPWSLWILASYALLLMFPGTRRFAFWITLTAALPVLWTFHLLLRFCREELRLGILRSWTRVATHQAVTYTIVFAYIFVAVSLWPRILGLFV
jgi:hypothetical protein